MPKIIDHEQYRKELALKAAPIFAQHGYSGLGMRQIAQELGLSKSALYHYFPSKDALFAACTELVTGQDTDNLQMMQTDTDDLEGNVSQLLKYFEDNEGNFKRDLALLFDYLRDREAAEIANDPNMQIANKNYLSSVAALVGDKHAKPVLCLVYGLLLQRLFDGESTEFSEIEAWLKSQIA